MIKMTALDLMLKIDHELHILSGEVYNYELAYRDETNPKVDVVVWKHKNPTHQVKRSVYLNDIGRTTMVENIVRGFLDSL